MLLKLAKLAGCRIEKKQVIFSSKKEMDGYFKRIAQLEDRFWEIKEAPDETFIEQRSKPLIKRSGEKPKER